MPFFYTLEPNGGFEMAAHRQSLNTEKAVALVTGTW